jgi:hypothetical protein
MGIDRGGRARNNGFIMSIKRSDLLTFSLRCALLLAAPLPGTVFAGTGYVVAVSESTREDAAWQPVIAALVEKYPGALEKTYPAGKVGALSEELSKLLPERVCFVAKPEEATRAFVASVHQLMRGLDEDPYTDGLWGILTGHDAANALEIAKTKTPLEIARVAAGTEVALDRCREGLWYCELTPERRVEKKAGGEAVDGKGPLDTTKALVDTLNGYKAQLFVTSGHATERDWQIGFRYRNGSFRSEDGRLFGVDTKGERFPVESPEPKVYLPIGNCLMGHIDGKDAMALAWMKSAGVRQMLGYTVPTWYGYAGWGCLDYFVEQPGRYNFVEAFFANEHALIHRLVTAFPGLERTELKTPDDAQAAVQAWKGSAGAAKEMGLTRQDALGLLFDRDAVVLYGDPGWEARMAPGPLSYGQSLKEVDGVFTLTITPDSGAKSYEPVNLNGTQRGGRPMVAFFPERLKNLRLVKGAEWKPVLADDFILVPNPGKEGAGKALQVVFTAERG